MQAAALSSSVIGIIAFDHYYILTVRYNYEPHLQMGKTERFDNLAKGTQRHGSSMAESWIQLIPISKPKAPPSKSQTWASLSSPCHLPKHLQFLLNAELFNCPGSCQLFPKMLPSTLLPCHQPAKPHIFIQQDSSCPVRIPKPAAKMGTFSPHLISVSSCPDAVWRMGSQR